MGGRVSFASQQVCHFHNPSDIMRSPNPGCHTMGHFAHCFCFLYEVPRPRDEQTRFLGILGGLPNNSTSLVIKQFAIENHPSSSMIFPLKSFIYKGYAHVFSCLTHHRLHWSRFRYQALLPLAVHLPPIRSVLQ